MHLAPPPAAAPGPTPAHLHVPADRLAARVAHILAAPTDDGPIAMLVRRPDVLAREVVASADLDPGVGMVGDTWASRPSRRTPDGSPHVGMQLTLMSTRVADALTDGDRDRWPLAGDQVYVDLDLSATAMPDGSRWRVGTAEVVISGVPHTGCALFAERFGTDALRFVNTGQGRPGRWRGVNATVVTAGRVAVGDRVSRLG